MQRHRATSALSNDTCDIFLSCHLNPRRKSNNEGVTPHRSQTHQNIHPAHHQQILLIKRKRNANTVFLTPCVTVRGHYWLGEGQTAHPENHGVKKLKYKSYWKTINNLGGWLDRRYTQRMIAAGGAVHDKRELMLNCVVNQLRQLYLNPPDMAYMGHMWI